MSLRCLVLGLHFISLYDEAGCVLQADGHTIVAASTAEKAVREGLEKTADVRVCRPCRHKLCLGALPSSPANTNEAIVQVFPRLSSG